MHKTKKEGIEN